MDAKLPYTDYCKCTHIMCNNRDITAAEVLKDGGQDSITHSYFNAHAQFDSLNDCCLLQSHDYLVN